MTRRKHDPDERVVLPLDPETALRGLLQVDPTKIDIDDEDPERKSAERRRKPQ